LGCLLPRRKKRMIPMFKKEKFALPARGGGGGSSNSRKIFITQEEKSQCPVSAGMGEDS